MLKVGLIQLGEHEILKEGFMETPFTTEDLKNLIDVGTGGDPTDSIILKEIDCSGYTGSGLLDCLSEHGHSAKTLKVDDFRPNIFPMDRNVVESFAGKCSSLEQLEMTNMSELNKDARDDLVYLATEAI